MKLPIVILLSFCIVSCADIPEGVDPVSGFELDRYMGEWFEIARLDHRFERGLQQVTATYTVQDDGTVRVINRGYMPDEGEWKQATGKARLAGAPGVGHLEVSFFGPFYGPYIIFELDKTDYQYAFVTSGEGYLWLLSRSPSVSSELTQRFLDVARELGFPTEELIFVEHH